MSDKDTIYLQDAIDIVSDECGELRGVFGRIEERLKALPSAQTEEVIPHRNYKYLSDYWCKCGWHLGKKGDVKYCSGCGRKVNWDG